MKHYFIALCFLLTGYNAFTQKKDQMQLLKISEDDDFFNLRGEGTDRGYSSGIKLEFYYTKNVPATFPGNLLLKMNGYADNLYSWGIAQNLYTPKDITIKQIQYNDRPYAATLLLSHTLISSDRIKRQKLTTTLSVGVIGEYALGRQVQTWAHSVINYQRPQGWDNQVSNDLLLNYFISYEKMIFSPSPNLEIIGNVASNAGTLYNNVGIGLQFRAGLFNNYFSSSEKPAYNSGSIEPGKKKTQFYIYMKTDVTAVMDNSVLQGGFITHNSSPYVIAKDSINRVFMQYEYGLVYAHKRFGIAFYEKLRTPEFKGFYTQQIGNLTLYFGL